MEQVNVIPSIERKFQDFIPSFLRIIFITEGLGALMAKPWYETGWLSAFVQRQTGVGDLPQRDIAPTISYLKKNLYLFGI